jgi:hypothetical protein
MESQVAGPEIVAPLKLRVPARVTEFPSPKSAVHT